MLKLLKHCVSWLNWKTGLGIVLAIVVLASFDKLLGLAVLAGATPILLALACLIPCLIPLAFLGKKKTASSSVQATISTSGTCNCGNDSCQSTEGSSCQSNAKVAS